MRVVLNFDGRNGYVRFEIEYNVSSFPLPTIRLVTFYNESPICEKDFFTNLGFKIPASLDESRYHVLGDNVSLGKFVSVRKLTGLKSPAIFS